MSKLDSPEAEPELGTEVSYILPTTLGSPIVYVVWNSSCFSMCSLSFSIMQVLSTYNDTTHFWDLYHFYKYLLIILHVST